jgi:hypothetical protein
MNRVPVLTEETGLLGSTYCNRPRTLPRRDGEDSQQVVVFLDRVLPALALAQRRPAILGHSARTDPCFTRSLSERNLTIPHLRNGFDYPLPRVLERIRPCKVLSLGTRGSSFPRCAVCARPRASFSVSGPFVWKGWLVLFRPLSSRPFA